jgi:hypothetical protein
MGEKVDIFSDQRRKGALKTTKLVTIILAHSVATKTTSIKNNTSGIEKFADKHTQTLKQPSKFL